jgi:hypothetical protein
VAAIAWGALNCFFGYRIFKVTLALQGGLAGGIFGQAAGAALGLGPAGEIGGLVAGALLGAGLAFLLYLAAVFMAGFFFGAALGILLLSHFHQMVALLSGCVLGVIGGFLAVKLQRVLIVLSTALVGAFLALLALSYFTSRTDWIFHARHPEQLPALIDGHAWLLPAILVLAAAGVITQLELGGAAPKKKAKAPAE